MSTTNESEMGHWWVVDRNHGDAKKRGPYKHIETAAAIRAEMESNAEDATNEYWNLAVMRLVPKE